jgi:ribose transport system permease protein
VSRIKFSVFVVNGVLASIAGFILASRLGSANPSQGMGLELDGICAAILGGTALSGGIGRIGGAVLGAITLQFLRNGLNLVGISSSIQMLLVGAAIITILIFDSVCNRIADERRRRG